ncbi:DUF7010 family protein [Kineococcus sp. SYSU DK006]|uniref:DUF7010 family protein n=1 Tax=Kineococcus sp. SYSU DK006 TaxID=3383127 RepID=UPI003D7D0422
MQITDAQADVRRTYRGGSVGQAVSGIVWAAAGIVHVTASPAAAMAVLFLGGAAIFPLTSVLLRLLGGRASLPAGHPMAALGAQVAFTVPVGMLVAVALGSRDVDLFFPAGMLVVGAHYLPFVHLYGDRSFAALAVVLVAAGFVIATGTSSSAPIGAWFTSAVLLLAAVVLHVRHRRSPEGGAAPAEQLSGVR